MKERLARGLREELKGSILQLMEREAHWKRACEVSCDEGGAAERYRCGAHRFRGFLIRLESAVVGQLLQRWHQKSTFSRVWSEREEAVSLLQVLHQDHHRLQGILQLQKGLAESRISGQAAGLASDMEAMEAKSELRERDELILELREALSVARVDAVRGEERLVEAAGELERRDVLVSEMEEEHRLAAEYIDELKGELDAAEGLLRAFQAIGPNPIEIARKAQWLTEQVEHGRRQLTEAHNEQERLGTELHKALEASPSKPPRSPSP